MPAHYSFCGSRCSRYRSSTHWIEASLLQLFAKRADRWTQERLDFGLRLARPAHRPKQCARARSQVSSGKAVPRQKRRSLECIVEPVERQQKAPFSLWRLFSALMFMN